MENLTAPIMGHIVAFVPSVIRVSKRFWDDDSVSLSAIEKSPEVIAEVNSKGVSREILLQCALKTPSVLRLFFGEPWGSYEDDEWRDGAALILASHCAATHLCAI